MKLITLKTIIRIIILAYSCLSEIIQCLFFFPQKKKTLDKVSKLGNFEEETAKLITFKLINKLYTLLNI